MNKSVIFRDGLGGKRCLVLFDGEQGFCFFTKRGGNLVSFAFKDRLVSTGCCDRGGGDTGFFSQRFAGGLPFLQISAEIGLCRCAVPSLPDPFFLQILIEQIQMLRADIAQPQMPDRLIAAGKEIFVVRLRPIT